MNTESAQRRKARLERHQRIMERAVCTSLLYFELIVRIRDLF